MANTPAPFSVVKNITSVIKNITSEALKYWINELGNRSESTLDLYLRMFQKFLDFTGKTPDELLQQRAEDQRSPDIKTQRRTESQLIQFLKEAKTKGYSPASLQTIYASVRSFFETHYYPLRMRRGDYPKGESVGVRAASKDMIQRVLDQTNARNKAETRAIILFLKDSGLRVSDARQLNYGDLRKQIEKGEKTIPITKITQKSKIIAKTFIGEEAIEALKDYIQARRNGTRRVPPEAVTDDSPLFRTWESHTAQRIPRSTISSIVRSAFARINEPSVSAHSLRKYLQTSLEAAGTNVNWIDQMLGHRLINSRDAYSKPTDEQLKEAYAKAYKTLRIYPEIITPEVAPAQPAATQTKEKTNEFILKTTQNIAEITKALSEMMKQTAT